MDFVIIFAVPSIGRTGRERATHGLLETWPPRIQCLSLPPRPRGLTMGSCVRSLRKGHMGRSHRLDASGSENPGKTT